MIDSRTASRLLRRPQVVRFFKNDAENFSRTIFGKYESETIYEHLKNFYEYNAG